jgi:hypothetical protein
MPSLTPALPLHVLVVTLASLSLGASRPQEPTPAPAAALSSILFVATDDEVLTVAWPDGEPRIVAREQLAAASAEVRRLLTRGRVDDPARGEVYVVRDGLLQTYRVDPWSGAITARWTLRLFTLRERGTASALQDDLVAVPGSDELLRVGSDGNTLSLPWSPFGRPHRGLPAGVTVQSVSIDMSTHRIAYIAEEAHDPSRARLRFANPPGELDLGDETPTLVRWSVPPTTGPALPEVLPPPAKPSVGFAIRLETRLAFGSCADEDKGTGRVWRLLNALSPDAVVLLGDTPYIDTTDPEVQARRYREFAAFPPFAELARSTSVFGTWDDHDFGADGSDGRLQGKEHARAAFVAARSSLPDALPSDPARVPSVTIDGGKEYSDPQRVVPTFGADGAGVYSSFRRGHVEVFLLDTRWFARTGPSEFDPAQPTLLGAEQWAWLRAGLRASTASFKVLACGMIWNGAVRPGKDDHWGAYPAEFDGLCRFLGAEAIEGVVLVGGDIHRSRVVVHATAERVGYDVTELISSPMHGRVIENANAPHPGLRFDSGEGHVVCIVAADDQELRAIFRTPDAILHTEVIARSSLVKPR